MTNLRYFSLYFQVSASLDMYPIFNGFSITFHLITQSKLLGGSTPQTPRWGRGAAPKPPAH
ncbi:MAG: hypothetical protein EWV50_03005 [Microcystis aeruginosa Ma_MB_F_20061100_S20]|uniref:Mobile element protein n=1 Tax=Microcystis aeruginosa Ma_MB_F_20061100_S20D TaxID=2486253 RepID=A0A552E8L8_MICAE|nr:MAG: hypothetical protein EWV78_22220 [Microcystis aeruginosa Ma_MB_F_20061100_S20D]TRU42494.1 MAG: hypothetical protein EWV50_03005 [Microcystis aeruginosa Ma_MB_F_20061100_S20]